MEKKKDKIIDHLNKAIQACTTGYVVLNYSSGTGFPFLRLDNYPKSLAKKKSTLGYIIISKALLNRISSFVLGL